ncbi:MAG: hypothetical protein ACE5I2_14790 [Anaerolineae bacterium]
MSKKLSTFISQTIQVCSLIEAVFSGEEPPEAVIAYPKGKPWEEMRAEDYPTEVVEPIRGNILTRRRG